MTLVQVDEHVWRGSALLVEGDWVALRSLGIKFDLDLQSGLIADGDPAAEVGLANAFGITTLRMPMGVILPPTHEELNRALDVIASKQPIFIHCRDGVDRTGMVCAWYRMRTQGWSRKAAVDEMVRLGSHWWYWYWRFTL